ncbi:response regulator transcription factor [Emticicia sp. SJ17W-69]|uniref:response regulator transcription factor n=1 Tax=Emticicia sp. SJ17W-69 TaxID=3421657 RepID=UPI003EBE0581
MKPKVKLFLADSYYLFVEGLSMMLASTDDFQVIGMARNVQETLHELQKNTCDVLVIDANFFFQGNIQFDQVLKGIYHEKILVLHDSMSVNCLKKIEGKVDGFISKSATRFQLFDTIYSVLNGTKSKKAHSFFQTNTNFQQELITRYALTPREVEVIKLIALEFLSSEIATKLCVSEFTVDTYRKNITKKLNARNVVSIVNFAHRWQLV